MVDKHGESTPRTTPGQMAHYFFRFVLDPWVQRLRAMLLQTGEESDLVPWQKT